jgi:hypothetical protein
MLAEKSRVGPLSHGPGGNSSEVRNLHKSSHGHIGQQPLDLSGNTNVQRVLEDRNGPTPRKSYRSQQQRAGWTTIRLHKSKLTEL